MKPARIPAWEQKRALATHIYERGALEARYLGQMADIVGAVLNKHLERVKPFDGSDGGRLMNQIRQEDADLFEIIGGASTGKAIITAIKYIGPPPEDVPWQPISERPPVTPLAARVEELERQVARIPFLIQQAVQLALEELVK